MKRPGDDAETNSQSPSKRANYGFNPMSDQSSSEEGDADDGAGGGEPVSQRDFYIRVINKYAARYPGVEPRSTHTLMDALRKMSDEELENIMLNFEVAIVDQRGSPAADLILLFAKIIIDPFVPTFSERCSKDIEMRRDIESEFMTWFGWIGHKLNIAFRGAKHMYEALQEKAKREAELASYGTMMESRAQNETTIGGTVGYGGLPVGEEIQIRE